MSWIQLVQGDSEAAIAHARSATPSPAARRVMRDYWLAAGDADAALELYVDAFGGLFSPTEPLNATNYRLALDAALVLQHLHRPDEAASLLDAVEGFLIAERRLAREGYRIADVDLWALRGDTDRAFDALEDAVAAGWRFGWRIHLIYNRNLQSLADDPRFDRIALQLSDEMDRQRQRAATLAPAGLRPGADVN